MSGSRYTDGGEQSLLGALIAKVPSAGIGVLAAIVTVLVMDHLRAKEPSTPVARDGDGHTVPGAPSDERVIRSVVVDRKVFDRITELERRFRELQEARAASSADPSGPDERLTDPEEARRKVDESYAELDRSHEGDAPDPTWAPDATSRFTTGLTALGEELGFKVALADCKVTSCRATVTWNDYSAARATGTQLVERFLGGLNCGQKIRLDAPADPNVPYSTKLYLDCTDLRSGAVEEIARVTAD